jgi:hypothetical protein
MQPSTLPGKLLVVGLLGLLALTLTPSASALAWMTNNQAVRIAYYNEGGIGVWYEVDPETGQTTAKMCVTRDSYYPEPVPADAHNEDDGSWSLWVAAGISPSDGSEKANTASCVSAPPGGLPHPDLPGGVRFS